MSLVRKSHFRGVVWPRKPQEGPSGKVYRYTVVGLLVTNEPIPELDGFTDGISQTALAGRAPGLAEALADIPHGEVAHRLGDATSVLVSLDAIKEVK